MKTFSTPGNSLPIALPAAAVPIRADIGIGRIEGMTVNAHFLCASGGSYRPVAAKGVDATRHGLEVGRVDTGPVAAEVVENEAFGNRADHQFVTESMGGVFEAIVRKHPIPVVDASLPVPALISPSFVDLLPEAFHRPMVTDQGVRFA